MLEHMAECAFLVKDRIILHCIYYCYITCVCVCSSLCVCGGGVHVNAGVSRSQRYQVPWSRVTGVCQPADVGTGTGTQVLHS